MLDLRLQINLCWLHRASTSGFSWSPAHGPLKCAAPHGPCPACSCWPEKEMQSGEERPCRGQSTWSRLPLHRCNDPHLC